MRLPTPPASWRSGALALAMVAGGAVAPPGQAAPELSLAREPGIYAPGESVQVRVKGAAGGALKLYDWRGRALPAPRLAATGGTIELGPLPEGYYELAMGAGPAQTRRAFAVVASPHRGSHTFGVMTHFAQGWDTALIPLISRAGIGTVRDEQYWAQVEKKPGQYGTPPKYQSYMEGLARAGIEPLLVLSFANPGYDSGKTPHTPAGRAGFAAYGTEIARRTVGQVQALEVWNEINGSFCTGPCLKDRAGTYAALLADSHAALKRAYPKLTIVGGAAVKAPLPWYEALISRGAAQNWDVVAVHPYRADPEGAARDMHALRELLTRAGSKAPIWATEFGSGAGKRDAASRAATAAYLTRMAVVLRAAGVQRLYWYLLRDDSTFIGMGLLRTDRDPLGRNAPTPAYAAYATLISMLDGAHTVRREATDPRTHIYQVAHGAKLTRVLWAPEIPDSVTVELPDGGELTSLLGTPLTLPPGRHRLKLDAYPQYLSGTVQSLTEHRTDQVVAEARGDFQTDAAVGPWQSGAYVVPTATASPPPELSPETFASVGTRTNAWEKFSGDKRWPALRVSVDGMHPGRTQDAQVWAVRRYRSPHDGPLRVRGQFTRSGGGDGSGARILLDGKTVFEAQLSPQGRQKADFDLVLTARRGAVLDFVATPGAALNVDNDAVGFQVWISRPRKGG